MLMKIAKATFATLTILFLVAPLIAILPLAFTSSVILVRTFWIAALVTFFCACIGFPYAMIAASLTGWKRDLMLAAVLLPLSLRGVASGGLLVFISAIGYYITPALIGGPGDQMISSIIAFYATGSANWGMAGALGIVLLVATLLLYSVYARLSSDEPGRR